MTLLRIDASIQGPNSASSALADRVLEQFTALRPDEAVVSRHLGAQPLPSDAWQTAVFGGFTPEADRSPEQTEALALAAAIAEELRTADAGVFALPLYNWGVSQHVKTWIDLAIIGGGPGAALVESIPAASSEAPMAG